MQIYKIRRKSDGLFSSGGTYILFTNKGKIWNARGHITSHLSHLSARDKKVHYSDCEVVCFEVQEIKIGSTDVSDWAPLPSTIRAKELEEQRGLEREKQRKLDEITRLEKELAKLKKR